MVRTSSGGHCCSWDIPSLLFDQEAEVVAAMTAVGPYSCQEYSTRIFPAGIWDALT